MLHELLLALKGHYGGAFKHSNDGITVVPDLPFMHTSEVKVLNHLCQLGTYYKDYREFIQHYGSGLLSQQKPGTDDLHGLYLKCVCQGVDSVLEDYRASLQQLEQDVLQDAHLPLSHFSCKLQQYHLLFPALASTLDEIVSNRAHGCYILDILYKNAMFGKPVVKDALNRILYLCHGLMYKQLSAWMLHGITSDPYKEFFIQKAQDGLATVSKQAEDEEEDLGILGLTGRQLQKIHIGSDVEDVSSEAGQFCIAADLLPSYIQPRVANKILFVGESVQMFEKDKHKMKSSKSGTIMSSREGEFAADLQRLSKEPEFNSISFETIIDKIRAHAAEYLWVIIVEESDLANELKVMKDYFLLGRGELYLAFIDQAQHLLHTPVAATTEHDVNRAFQHAARNVLIDNDLLLQRFRLTVPLPSKDLRKAEVASAQTEPEVGWTVLGLTYSVPWPLHIFFTSSMLEKYNRIFRFLLAVRRTQLDLQHCWSLQMFNKEKFVSPAASATWQLRTHMAFLVDNLQYYLQVDVIESHYKILLDKINSTKDFEAAKLAHEHFLSSLLAQSFVHMKTVFSCLHEILDQCSSFCRLLVSAQQELTEKENDQLQNITLSFQRHSSLLFRILSGVHSQSSRPHLAQLLLRLDFNKFFTNMGDPILLVYLYLTLQTARPDVWLGLGLLYTPAHPFSSTTQLRSRTVPDTLGPVSAKLSKHCCITAGSKASSLVEDLPKNVNVKVEDYRVGKLT
ncbi:gamma-tubulin complex component [Plakobranchus ocellatus]|uniref:Gamma-tubulin complex component n=1 Tax=Plakobranchus ocellatus TaxID=259542 RepID=A0AAV4DD56_9GAST|nr:gamma-tubulin complex component [Plakobranchus ocellatus]